MGKRVIMGLYGTMYIKVLKIVKQYRIWRIVYSIEFLKFHFKWLLGTNINIVWTFLPNVKALTDNLMPKLNFIWFYLSRLISSVIVSKGREGIVGKSPSKIYHVSLPILFPLREGKISSPPAAPPTLIFIYTCSYSYKHTHMPYH